MTYPKREPYYNLPRTTAAERAARRTERLRREANRNKIVFSTSTIVTGVTAAIVSVQDKDGTGLFDGLFLACAGFIGLLS